MDQPLIDFRVDGVNFSVFPRPRSLSCGISKIDSLARELTDQDFCETTLSRQRCPNFLVLYVVIERLELAP